MTGTPGAVEGAPVPARPSRWFRVMLGMIAIGLVVALFWIALASRAIVSGADDRNQADLAIAASGLEQWSGAVSGLARANFIRGRVFPLSQDERDYSEGWQFRAWLRHPALDEFKIVYTVTSEDGCEKIRRRIIADEGTLPFVDDYNSQGGKFLKIVDSFPLLSIMQQDAGPGAASASRKDRRRYLDNIVGAVPKGAADPGAQDVVCFAAGISLDRLLVIDKAARAFSTLMIVDSARRVIAQIGSDRVPVTSLNGLAPVNSVLTRTLAASLGQQPARDPPERKLADNLDPVDLDIAGRKFVAYVRPLFTPPRFDVCAPKPAVVAPTRLETRTSLNADASAATATTTLASAPTSAGKRRVPTTDCLVVALAPKSTVWLQVVGLPLVIGVSLGLVVLMLIAMLPSLRLILLGPGEALGRSEAIGVALGIPAVTSLATLALLFAFDLAAHREAARDRAAAIVARAARDTQRQIAEATMLIRSVSIGASRATFPALAHPSPDRHHHAIEGCVSQEPDGSADLSTDPQPLCRLETFCRFRRLSGLPVIDTVGLFDEDGRQLRGSHMGVCRGFAGGRANVSAREYFLRLRADSPALLDEPSAAAEEEARQRANLPRDPPAEGAHQPFVVSYVAALQDGIAKSIVATEAIPARRPAPARGAARRDRVFVIGTTTLTNAMAPVLPPPFGLMIVDTRNNALPVLLHPTPGRSGVETLARMLPNPGAVRARLRALHEPGGGNGRPARFVGFYDGARRMFVARPIAGTPWVAIVHYSLAEIDRSAAQTAVQTLQSWAAFSIVSVGLWLLWLAGAGRRGWRRLWPQRASEGDYGRFAIGFTALAALAAALIVMADRMDGPSSAAIVVLIGFGTRLVAGVALHAAPAFRRRRGDAAMPDGDALKTTLHAATQHRYVRMVAALLLCLSVVPMLGFWIDARHYTATQVRHETLAGMVAPDGALPANRLVFDRLRWAYGLADPQPRPGDVGVDDAPGVYGVAHRRVPKLRPDNAAFFSPFFSTIGGGPDIPPVHGCPRDDRASGRDAAKAHPPQVDICEVDKQYGIEVAGTGLPNGVALVLVAVLGLGLFFAIRLLVLRVLRALAGFGVALGGVTYPRLFLGDLWGGTAPNGTVVLNRKSLLVNAPWVIFAMLTRGGVDHRIVRLHVADPHPRPAVIVEGSIVIVTGLELVLADRERRLRALGLLELAGRNLAALGVATRTRLIIMSEAAPLERILDAFERDDSQPDFDTARESLRWSRLFEDFATYGFAQIRLTEPLSASDDRPADPEQRKIVDTVLEECRWLSPRIVNGGIGREIMLEEEHLDAAVVPVGDHVYQALYRAPLIEWTLARDFPGPNSARAHLRNQFIENYQRLWLSSTDAEHLVMHNLAHCRFVNIGAALAFGSLVRRGIVVLDPEPRLMNRSFVLFVRQVEKLGTIRKWREALPAGAWQTARWPIYALIAVALAVLIGVVIFSGEEPSSLLPVLAAGIPAIVAAARRVLRP